MQLKRYEGDVEDLCLFFAIEQEAFGRHQAFELVPGGADVAVTAANRLAYVASVSDFRLNRVSGPGVAAFSRGLGQLVPRRWLSLFSPQELNQLISGGGAEVDVDDLRAHTAYAGGFGPSSRTVGLFWAAVATLSGPQRRGLLKFVTSCSRPPLQGFAHLHPPFTIAKVPCDAPPWAPLFGADVERLPSASTCYNLLKLPNYRRAATLRLKLLQAIDSGSGFDLS